MGKLYVIYRDRGSTETCLMADTFASIFAAYKLTVSLFMQISVIMLKYLIVFCKRMMKEVCLL